MKKFKIVKGNKEIFANEKTYKLVYEQLGYKKAEEVVKDTVEETLENKEIALEDNTVEQLRQLAKDLKIENYSNLKKAELIEALKGV